jgi:hypothetical protein
VSAEDERLRVEDALRRIEDLVAGLSHIADPAARESARRLLEAVLDLHGLALARIITMLAASGDGSELLRRLAEDEQVKAVLLLYGLHPEEPRARIRRALERLRPKLAAAGIAAELVRVTATAAALRLIGGRAAETLRREVEEAVGNAAPDLDEITVDWLRDSDALPAATAVG